MGMDVETSKIFWFLASMHVINDNNIDIAKLCLTFDAHENRQYPFFLIPVLFMRFDLMNNQIYKGNRTNDYKNIGNHLATK